MGKLIRINLQKSTSLKDLNKFSLCNSRSVACYMINYMLPTDGCAFYLNVGHVIVVKNLAYEEVCLSATLAIGLWDNLYEMYLITINHCHTLAYFQNVVVLRAAPEAVVAVKLLCKYLFYR